MANDSRPAPLRVGQRVTIEAEVAYVNREGTHATVTVADDFFASVALKYLTPLSSSLPAEPPQGEESRADETRIRGVAWAVIGGAWEELDGYACEVAECLAADPKWLRLSEAPWDRIQQAVAQPRAPERTPDTSTEEAET
jgi:hypothetical protein